MSQLRMYSDQRGASSIYESGFSWLAALCPPVWFLQQHLYGLALVSLVECTAVQALLARSSLSQTWQWSLYILHLAAMGFVASPVQRWWLGRRGWFVTAEEPLRAPKTQA
jgi:Protein of unknown function (DUF2628)